MGKTFNDLYELRQEGDYVDLLYIDESEVRPKVAQAEIFVEGVVALATAVRDADEGEKDEPTGEVAVAEDDQQAAEGEDATGESPG